jgi:hypothetical protein
MNIEGILSLVAVLVIPCLFIYVFISALFTPYESESLRGERRKVEFNGETNKVWLYKTLSEAKNFIQICRKLRPEYSDFRIKVIKF